MGKREASAEFKHLATITRMIASRVYLRGKLVWIIGIHFDLRAMVNHFPVQVTLTRENLVSEVLHEE